MKPSRPQTLEPIGTATVSPTEDDSSSPLLYVFSDVARASSPASCWGVPPSNVLVEGERSALPAGEAARATLNTRPLQWDKGRYDGPLLVRIPIRTKSWFDYFPTLKLAILILIGLPSIAHAHDPGLSSALITLRRSRIEITLTFAKKDAEQLLQHRGTVDPLVVDSPRNDSDQNAFAKLVSDEFRLEYDRRNGPVLELTLRSEDKNNTTVSWVVPCDACSSLKIESRLLRQLPPGHRQYLAVRIGDSQSIAERLLSAQDPRVVIAIPQEVPPETSAGSTISFLQMGVKHILTGYDHLLFLFGLLIVTRRFSSALRIITCFTIAHSITLALATLSPLPAPPRLVEPLIAASIVYVGLENLARGGEPKGRWFLTFIFGLIHGCGFASALRELGIGTAGRGIALPLICFNGGVELGQLMLAGVLLPLIWKAQARPAFVQRVVPASSAAVVLLGGYWLVQRLWMS